ncbi:unnamed protein product [Urochloa humidicola]
MIKQLMYRIWSFFNGIKSHARSGCEGTGFYTRGAFLTAAAAFPGFARGGAEAKRKGEIAAFFTHIMHETGYLCYIHEVDGACSSYCNQSDEKQWPCYPGQGYYGRGPLQLSRNFNYGPAGRNIGFDGLRDPEVVAQDPVVSFKSALSYWMANMHGVMPQGFGATIRTINGVDSATAGRTPLKWRRECVSTWSTASGLALTRGATTTGKSEYAECQTVCQVRC